MPDLRFGLIGAGFWSKYQMHGWREAGGAQCVAICDRDLSKAKSLADQFGVERFYADAATMLDSEQLDVVDIVASIEAHAPLVKLAAARGLPVICQKPMSDRLGEAEEMVATCRKAGVPFLIHENNRWYNTIRELKKVLDSGVIGRPFRGRVEYCNGVTPFENQPYLKEVERLILADMGSHILDVARFLFGEARSLYCQTRQVTPGIRAEDVATVMMDMGPGTTVTCELSYVSKFERDPYCEILALVEGERGSVELAQDFWVRVTTDQGTFAKRHPPPIYPWVDPVEGIGLTCIVDCVRHLRDALQGKCRAETTGEDNLKTVRLFLGSYESAAENKVVRLP
jgi:predicted dehydrogenase